MTEQEEELFHEVHPKEWLEVLRIFERKNNEEKIPEGFNGTTIILNARSESSLEWQKEIEAANRLKDEGYKILFDLDLGLFSHLKHPLTHKNQFQALSYALDHFYTKVWEPLKEHSVGAIISRLDLPFELASNEVTDYHFEEWLSSHGENKHNPLLKPLYARDVIADFLELLTSPYPDTLLFF